MQPTTRQQLKNYALRQLGAPVIQINVDDTQLEDRLDDSIMFWTLYHPFGSKRVFLRLVMDPSLLTFTTPDIVGLGFHVGDTITGSNSGATASITIRGGETASQLGIFEIKGTFQMGELVTCTQTDAQAVLVSTPNFYSEGTMQREYVPMDPKVLGVAQILPFFNKQNGSYLFNVNYQFMMSLLDLRAIARSDLNSYVVSRQYMDMLSFELGMHPSFEFNVREGNLYITMDWTKDIAPWDLVVVEAYVALDETTVTGMWSDPWLKKYTTALFKKQWGSNIKKYQGIALPGGVTLDGKSIFDEAVQEIKDLETELQTKAAPLQFFVG